MQVIEGENFSSTSSGSSTGCRQPADGWSSCVWGADDNLFASDVSNVMHSRVAYLHADADARPGSSATAVVAVNSSGPHHVLIRYEAGYRFSSPFRVAAYQGDPPTKVFEHVYGLRHSPKVWPFWNSRHSDWTSGCGPGLQAECRWIYSSTENMVWEGTEAIANLTAGRVSLEITAVCVDGGTGCDVSDGDRWGVESSPVPTPHSPLITERNIDVVVLTPNSSDIELRMNATSGASGSDSDGLIFDAYIATQEGEVFAKVTSESDVPMTLQFPRTVNRSPLWFGRIHYPTWMNTTTLDRTTHTSVTKWVLNDGCGERNTGSVSYAANDSMPAPPATPQSQCVFAQLGPRETSGWIDVGRMM